MNNLSKRLTVKAEIIKHLDDAIMRLIRGEASSEVKMILLSRAGEAANNGNDARAELTLEISKLLMTQD